MPLQILKLKLDGVTAGDYLTWCRDPDPPALDLAVRSISIDADPLGDTITAILDWNQPPPVAPDAAITAGLPLSADVQVHQLLTHGLRAGAAATEAGRHRACVHFAAVGGESTTPSSGSPTRRGSKVNSAPPPSTTTRQADVLGGSTSNSAAQFWIEQAYHRLRRIKTAVDPDDVIRSNHPIPVRR